MFKKILTVSVAMMLMSTTFISSIFAATGSTNQYVNLRTLPKSDSQVIKSLQPKTNIEILSYVNQYWVKVEVDSKVGYIDRSKVVDSFASVISDVNLRSKPNTSSKIIRVLKGKENITILEKYNSSWFYAKTKSGEIGYVSSKYVTRNVTAQKPPEKEVIFKDDLFGDILKSGKNYLGVPYKYGATPGSGYFDCSLFIQTIFKENGVTLPRNSRQQSTIGTVVSKSNIQAGDLLFFSTKSTMNKSGTDKIGHVAMYIGDGNMIHTGGKGGVKIESINTKWWTEHYITARKVLK